MANHISNSFYCLLDFFYPPTSDKHAYISGTVCAPMYGPWSENLSLWLVNNKGADQPVHPSRMISTFIIPFFGKYISTRYTRNSNFLFSLCS